MFEVPKPCVVDTNVAIVANGNSEQADDSLVEKCIDSLLSLTQNGGLTLDEGDRIFNEYHQNLSLSGESGTGDMFMKWVHDHRWNPDWCEMRNVHCIDEANQNFREFPDDPELKEFDISDRKFVAVANAKEPKATILQAVDVKWWGWKNALERSGIPVLFLLPQEEMEQRYREKMNHA